MSLILDGSASVTINSGAILGITSGTAVASTSGTSIDFTSIPSWVKRVTVMFSGVSTSSTSLVQIQLGSTTFSTTGYSSFASTTEGSGAGSATSTTGLLIDAGGSTAYVRSGLMIITNISSNLWVYNSLQGVAGGAGSRTHYSGGVAPTLAGALDRVRITTVNGTDTFDAGTINILYE